MSNGQIAGAWIGGIAAAILLVLVLMIGFPKYRVWQRELAGQASLAEASWVRKIVVEEAQASRDAASLLAERDSIEALGVASANRILGESLKDNESYLRYLWIKGLQDGNSEVIYVPTEANLPILEATRLP